jgi:NTE family protein
MEIDIGRPQRWALALSGGAARGVAHAGVLKVLEEEGLRPDLIVGTSAGALAGVFLAAGVSAARTVMWAESLRWSSLARPALNRLGLLSNERLGDLLDRALPARSFDELLIPFACMATDLQSGEPVILGEGDLNSAVRASCAIPGLFLPVERDGRLLIDGGVMSNVPTAATRLLGAELVVAVDVNGPYHRAEPPGNMLAIMVQTFFTLSRASELVDGKAADLLIAPDVAAIGYDQLHRAAELIAAGEAATRAALPALRRLLFGIESGGTSSLAAEAVA